MDRKVECDAGVFAFLDELLEGDVHGKRVLSLANATLGVMVSASLAVAVIGRSLAQARGLLTRHAIKQVDRLLSNQAIDPWDIAARWVPEVVGPATDIQVVMDWTDFDADGQTTLALNKVTPHGRATPLLWLTVMKDDLEEQAQRLRGRLPEEAGRSSARGRQGDDPGGPRLWRYETVRLSRDARLRLCDPVPGQHARHGGDGGAPPGCGLGRQGRPRRQAGWGSPDGSEHPVGAVVCVHAKGMKEPWCLATSFGGATAREIVDAYAKRWTIEPSFRDTKDIRFGMGLSLLRISRPDRRDRLLLINAFAVHLLTMLGTAGEELGMDRQLRSGTSNRRTHSLFRQGCMLYDLIPNMPEVRLRPLMKRFAEVMQRSSAIQSLVAVP